MAFEYIKEEDLHKRYEDAKRFTDPLFDPFDEFERISRNRPHPGIAPNLPKVTDGTLAAIVQDTPKRVIQQIPTGKVKVPGNKWLELVAGYILEHVILENSDEDADLIQKCWALVSKVLTFGSQPGFVQFVHRGDYFGTDFSLPYIKDVRLEPGKVSDRASKVMYLTTWWTESQIDYIIYKEEYLANKAQARDEEYEGDWDVPKLQELKAEGLKQKDQKSMSPTEKDKKINNGFYEIVVVFQCGIGATFYSFSPQLEDGANVVRRKKSKDPRGVIPIHFMYANIDFSNPYGRGAIEMSGGMQNLLDSEVQGYQYNRALMMNPPVKKRGNFPASEIRYEPMAVWDLGNEANADVEVVELSTTAVEKFPENYGLIKSQILNLNNSQDTSISAEVGNPGFSKTDAGVHANEARLGISDNYLRKQFESWWQQVMETELNLYFAERAGTQELQLDEETAAKLRKIDPNKVSTDGKVLINYDTETPKLHFKVDPSSSSIKDNAQQLEAATKVVDMVGKYPQFDAAQNGGKGIDTMELLDRVVAAIGLENPEKIVIRPEEELGPDGQPVQNDQNKLTPDQVMQMIQQAIDEAKLKPTEDPRITLVKALGGDNLPESTKQALLAAFQLPADGPSNKQTELELKAAETAAKVDTAATDQVVKAQDQNLKQSQHDLNVAKTGVDVAATVASHTLAEKTQGDNAAQAAAAHELSTATAGVDAATKVAGHELATQTQADNVANSQAQLADAAVARQDAAKLAATKEKAKPKLKSKPKAGVK